MGCILISAISELGSSQLFEPVGRWYVVSGAINTPALLLHSVVHRNGAVGQGLHLHPVTAVTGWFRESVKPWKGSIMTVIPSEIENRQGTRYGCKLEVFAF
ncbi:hypothetical protein VP01_1380g6 [Puccinia sorghi]|uniref:Uncharacterized protein n=1 Tax=Puccinia sorghi TaxID=27349 RepID=A0A0L6VLE9_9BASI|nr:hypothetical protein VP01_1380g6 [Puccinia sorghi]